MARYLFIVWVSVFFSGAAQALELTNRFVNLDDNITFESVRKAQDKLLEFNNISEDPIFLRLNSSGGSVEAGFILVDTIRAIRSPVYALIESKAHSMAAIIAVFCQKRYILPHATVMFHEASYGTAGEDPTNRSRMEFNSRYLDAIHREIAQRIHMPYEAYRTRIRDGWWMMAADAKKAGAVDEIVNDIRYTELVIESLEIKKTTTTLQKRLINGAFPNPLAVPASAPSANR